MRRGILVLVLLIVAVGSDLLSKWLVEANYPLMRPTQIIGDVLRFTPVYNTGSVFGGFQGNARLFHVLQGIGILFLVVYFRKTATRDMISTAGFGCLIGGALGNFIDKFFRHGVLDFIDMGIGNLRWYVYNVADIFIFIGIVLLLIQYKRNPPEEPKPASTK